MSDQLEQNAEVAPRRWVVTSRTMLTVLLAGLMTSIVVAWSGSAMTEPCGFLAPESESLELIQARKATLFDPAVFSAISGCRRYFSGGTGPASKQFEYLLVRRIVAEILSDAESRTSLLAGSSSSPSFFSATNAPWSASPPHHLNVHVPVPPPPPPTRIASLPFPNNWGQLSPWGFGPPDQDLARFVEDARGWPLPCVWCCLDLDAAGKGIAIGGFVIPGQASPNDLTKLRVLPYRPIWWGLLGNTLIYAAAWTLLVFGFTVPRRWLRVRRGVCGKCAYDLRSLPDAIERCPECGTPRRKAREIPTTSRPTQQRQNSPGP